MNAVEIVAFIIASGIVLAVLGNYIYKKIKHKPVGECAGCNKKMQKAFSDIDKEIKAERNLNCNQCSCK